MKINTIEIISVIFLLSISQNVQAQTGPDFDFGFFKPQTILSPEIPNGYNRGGNLSIDNVANPDYAQLPINVGSLDLYPQLDTYVGATSNVYLSKDDPIPSALVGSQFSLFANANWGVSDFVVIARDWQNEWIGHSLRSQNQGYVDASYQIDLTDSLKASVEGLYARTGDNNAIGTLNNLGSVLQITQRTYEAARLEYVSGHLREILSFDRTHFNLSPVDTVLTGLNLTYYDDHTVWRATSQTEYALSPSVSFFEQFSVYKTVYNTLLPDGEPNYNSVSLRNIIGISLDIPGLASGKISAGYARRVFDGSSYVSKGGFVISTKVEFFPDYDDNLTLIIIKDFDDGTITSSTPINYFWPSAVYEHRLARNMFAGFQLNIYKQSAEFITKYNSIGASVDSLARGGSIYFRYLMNHHFSFQPEFGFQHYINNSLVYNSVGSATNTEIRGILTLSYKP